MFNPANWCGLWFCITLLCGYGAKQLARRHRRRDEQIGTDDESEDDESLFSVEFEDAADADAIILAVK